MKITKLLIANRGEIALRIMKTAKQHDIETVAIYSAPDSEAPHVKFADEAFLLAGNTLKDTYLNIPQIIEIAKITEATAIHPAYGFLAENPLFVKECKKAGIIFIGPSEEVMHLMGNKIEARNFVKNVNIPLSEGAVGSVEELYQKALSIPMPILVKASAGGGGKGMRIVRNHNELKNAIEATSREALTYFGDGNVYIEQFIENPRHIEIQILADNFGNVIHLFERECSLQRRYQKIIEESPSPTVTPSLRQKMGEAAVAICKQVGYVSAGTIEFLVDKNLNFYFLEMNTRIQVEHPVTEMVTGIDIVWEQIKIAQNEPLSFQQNDIQQKGHAIECRIYAEQPEKNFLPSPGIITDYIQPSAKNLRIDAAIDKPTEIHSFFDPMISKLIVWGENRNQAITKAIETLQKYYIAGIFTNITYLISLLKSETFAQNQISTTYCDTLHNSLIENIAEERKDASTENYWFAYLLFSLFFSSEKKTLWQQIGYWRDIMAISFLFENKILFVEILEKNKNDLKILFQNKIYHLQVLKIDGNIIHYKVDNRFLQAHITLTATGNDCLIANGFLFPIKRLDFNMKEKIFKNEDNTKAQQFIKSPMPGKVIKLCVEQGQTIKKGEILLIVEAMKMENQLLANYNTTVKKINVAVGDMVETSKILMELNEEIQTM